MKSEEFGELIFNFNDDSGFYLHKSVGGSGGQGGCGGSGGCGGCANSVDNNQ